MFKKLRNKWFPEPKPVIYRGAGASLFGDKFSTRTKEEWDRIIAEMLGEKPIMSDLDKLAELLVENQVYFIGQLIANRKANNLSQGQVAVRMGVPLEVVQRLESDDGPVTLSDIRMYALCANAVISYNVTPFKSHK